MQVFKGVFVFREDEETKNEINNLSLEIADIIFTSNKQVNLVAFCFYVICFFVPSEFNASTSGVLDDRLSENQPI